MTDRSHPPSSVVIVGGGVGGVATAAALRSGGYDGDLTVIEASDVPYDRPPLSKGYLVGTQSTRDIALHSPEWYDEQAVRLVNNSVATKLLPAERRVVLSTGNSVTADRVVLATGGHGMRPPLPGSALPQVHVLRDREDADRLRTRLGHGARLLVVGAGLIGAEVASTASQCGTDVVLIDPVDVPLELAVGPEVGSWLHGLHAHHGITTLQDELVALDDNGDTILATLRNQPTPLEFDAVLLGVGLRVETGLAQDLGLVVDRGVVVDPGQVTSNPAVLAVGDSTRRMSRGTLLARAEHWEAAMHDGQRAAATILGTAPPPETAPWFWTDRHQHHVEAVGRMSAATERVLRGTPGNGPFSAWGLLDGRVAAAVAVDDPMAVRAARRMIDRRAPVTAELLADPTTNLRAVLAGSDTGTPHRSLISRTR